METRNKFLQQVLFILFFQENKGNRIQILYTALFHHKEQFSINKMHKVNLVNQKKKQNNQNIHLSIIRLQEIFITIQKTKSQIYFSRIFKQENHQEYTSKSLENVQLLLYIFNQKNMYQYEELLLKLRVNSINKPQSKSFGEFILLLNNQNNYKIRIQTSNCSRNFLKIKQTKNHFEEQLIKTFKMIQLRSRSKIRINQELNKMKIKNKYQKKRVLIIIQNIQKINIKINLNKIKQKKILEEHNILMIIKKVLNEEIKQKLRAKGKQQTIQKLK